MLISNLGRLAICSLFLGATVLAQETESELELAINDGQGDDVVIRFNSKEQGFNLHDLQIGETRSVNTVDGRPVVVTRVAEGYSFDVDGRTIAMPLMHEGDAGVRHKEVHVVRSMHGGSDEQPEGVTIISPTPLDDATRSAISGALSAAGQSDVRFITTEMMGPGPHGMHPPLPPMSPEEVGDVRVIRKEVHVTN
ncbi:MAG: hypothetical protein WBN32_03040 [Woeseia sp.]